jgi:predicted  nucleic acid-binding Zn-ribbon protein
MSQLFRECELECTEAIANVKRCIDTRSVYNIRIVQKQLKIAEDNVKQLELEASNVTQKDKISKYKLEIRKLREQCKKIDSSDLMGEDQTTNFDSRDKLQQSMQMLQNSQSTLDRILQVTGELESTANQTAENLKGQGDQIRNTKKKLEELHHDIRVGDRKIRDMSRFW